MFERGSKSSASMRSLPIIDPQWYDSQHCDGLDRDALTAELRRIDDRLASYSRVRSLRERRSQLLGQLRVATRHSDTKSPLSDAASSWLVRLSAGRLSRIDWPLNLFRDNANSYHRDSYQRTGVTINGRDESTCTAADRALAVMAVRMAAGDLLARAGRPVPLVFETHQELFADAVTAHRYDDMPLAYHEHGDPFRSNHPLAAALRDYSRSRSASGRVDQPSKSGCPTGTRRGADIPNPRPASRTCPPSAVETTLRR